MGQSIPSGVLKETYYNQPNYIKVRIEADQDNEGTKTFVVLDVEGVTYVTSDITLEYYVNNIYYGR